VILPDVQDKGFTHYQVIAKDTRTTGLNLTETVNLNIAVVSANGNKNLLVNGRLLGGSATDSGKVGKITLVNTATDTVVVNGGVEAAQRRYSSKYMTCSIIRLRTSQLILR